MSQQRVYSGFAYRQSRDPKARWIVSFVAPAEDLLEWAGIPRRASENLMGFQRTDDETRVERAKEFFNLGVNQSPTALIVGIHELPEGSHRSVELRFLDGSDTDSIRPCELTVGYDPQTVSLDQVRETIRRQIEFRL